MSSLIKNGKLGAIWEEFTNQLKAKGYEVKKGGHLGCHFHNI
jgi:hypothetical protein